MLKALFKDGNYMFIIEKKVFGGFFSFLTFLYPTDVLHKNDARSPIEFATEVKRVDVLFVATAI